MKRRLYPVVKHGARLAVISLFLFPAYCFAIALLISSGNTIAADWTVMYLCRPAGSSALVSQVIIMASAVILTTCWGTYEHRRRVRRLAANQPALKLQADAFVPLLAAAGPDTVAGGNVDL